MSQLPLGYVRMPGSRTLNLALAQFGLAADLVVIDCSAGITFGRRGALNDPNEKDPAKILTADQLAANQRYLRDSVDALAAALDISSSPLTTSGTVRPRITSIGFHHRPDKLPTDKLVQYAYTHGYVPGDPNEGEGIMPNEVAHSPSLGIVTPADLTTQLAMLMSFADAPPVFVVFVGKTRHGKPVVIQAAAQANWLVLSDWFDPSGPADQENRDLIGRLLHIVRQEAMEAGALWDTAGLYAFVGPGASEDFEFKGTRPQKLSATDRDAFVHTKEVPVRVGSDETETVPYLNLRGWTTRLLQRRGVPLDNVFVLEHNTVGSLCYASKRTIVGAERRAGSTLIPSNGMALRIRERQLDDELLVR